VNLSGLGRGVTSAFALIGAAIAAVLAGPAGPGVGPETRAGATTVFEPKAVTVVVTD
jgi:hypothetical protein